MGKEWPPCLRESLGEGHRDLLLECGSSKIGKVGPVSTSHGSPHLGTKGPQALCIFLSLSPSGELQILFEEGGFFPAGCHLGQCDRAETHVPEGLR